MNVTKNQKEEALTRIIKIQHNICDYVDTLVVKLTPLAKAGMLDIQKMDVYDVVEICYKSGDNTTVFGNFDKEFILTLFKTVFTEQFKNDMTRALRFQLYQTQLNN